jgi:homoserine O-acetyltransferase
MEENPMHAVHRLVVRAVLALVLAAPGLALAQDLIVKKEAFALPAYTAANGQTIRNVRVGYQTAGQLNAARDNVVVICHFFSGTSHAFGKYAAEDKAAGYWDAIIGPGKAIDTNRYFVISSDTLVNLNAKVPNVITTGPASVNPETGIQNYDMRTPVLHLGYNLMCRGPKANPRHCWSRLKTAAVAVWFS